MFDKLSATPELGAEVLSAARLDFLFIAICC